mmetsp:Transcript_44260/g.110260  ORF Transcript_44260/g.110260 Transcript_44260/m.110260 type:complete len:208 (+) Transcript_44260:728-1351(+)
MPCGRGTTRRCGKTPTCSSWTATSRSSPSSPAAPTRAASSSRTSPEQPSAAARSFSGTRPTRSNCSTRATRWSPRPPSRCKATRPPLCLCYWASLTSIATTWAPASTACVWGRRASSSFRRRRKTTSASWSTTTLAPSRVDSTQRGSSRCTSPGQAARSTKRSGTSRHSAHAPSHTPWESPSTSTRQRSMPPWPVPSHCKNTKPTTL